MNFWSDVIKETWKYIIKNSIYTSQLYKKIINMICILYILIFTIRFNDKKNEWNQYFKSVFKWNCTQLLILLQKNTKRKFLFILKDKLTDSSLNFNFHVNGIFFQQIFWYFDIIKYIFPITFYGDSFISSFFSSCSFVKVFLGEFRWWVYWIKNLCSCGRLLEFGNRFWWRKIDSWSRES